MLKEKYEKVGISHDLLTRYWNYERVSLPLKSFAKLFRGDTALYILEKGVVKGQMWTVIMPSFYPDAGFTYIESDCFVENVGDFGRIVTIIRQ